MSIDVDIAVRNRWNAAGLDSTLGALYPGDEVAAPEDTDLPRFDYYSSSDPLESESRSTITKLKQYTFEAWGATYEAVGGYIRTLIAALLNSDKASSNRLQMDASQGHILSTHEVDQGIEQIRENVFRGWYQMSVRWSKAQP